MPASIHSSVIAACSSCVQACQTCVKACLEENRPGELVRCIELNMECIVICRALADLLQLKSSRTSSLGALVVEACEVCALECEKHAAMDMEHCRICAEICRDCARQCSWMITGKMNLQEYADA